MAKRQDLKISKLCAEVLGLKSRSLKEAAQIIRERKKEEAVNGAKVEAGKVA